MTKVDYQMINWLQIIVQPQIDHKWPQAEGEG